MSLIPLRSRQRRRRLDRSGFSFATSQTQDPGINTARTRANLETRAQYDMMVCLSGGRQPAYVTARPNHCRKNAGERSYAKFQ